MSVTDMLEDTPADAERLRALETALDDMRSQAAAAKTVLDDILSRLSPSEKPGKGDTNRTNRIDFPNNTLDVIDPNWVLCLMRSALIEPNSTRRISFLPSSPLPLSSLMPLCGCEKYCMRYRTEPKQVSLTTYWNHKPYRKEHKVGSYAAFREGEEGSIGESQRRGQASHTGAWPIFQPIFFYSITHRHSSATRRRPVC
jgi:hypothetical protein